MACEVEFTDEFGAWWDGLTAGQQESVRAYVRLLAEFGVALKHPYCSGVTGSKHSHMRELGSGLLWWWASWLKSGLLRGLLFATFFCFPCGSQVSHIPESISHTSSHRGAHSEGTMCFSQGQIRWRVIVTDAVNNPAVQCALSACDSR